MYFPCQLPEDIPGSLSTVRATDLAQNPLTYSSLQIFLGIVVAEGFGQCDHRLR